MAAKKLASAALMHEVDVSNAALLERRRAEKAALVEQDKKIARFIQERDAREQVGRSLQLTYQTAVTGWNRCRSSSSDSVRSSCKTAARQWRATATPCRPASAPLSCGSGSTRVNVAGGHRGA